MQFFPVGQQRIVVFAARGIQVDVLGQQKFEGIDVILHCTAAESGQLVARSKISLNECAVTELETAKSIICLAKPVRLMSVYSSSASSRFRRL